MVVQNFAEVKLHRKNRLKSLASVNNFIKIRGSLNKLWAPFFIFMTTDLAAYMKYELAPRPSSLFDDTLLRRPAKNSAVLIFDDYAGPPTTKSKEK